MDFTHDPNLSFSGQNLSRISGSGIVAVIFGQGSEPDVIDFQRMDQAFGQPLDIVKITGVFAAVPGGLVAASRPQRSQKFRFQGQVLGLGLNEYFSDFKNFYIFNLLVDIINGCFDQSRDQRCAHDRLIFDQGI